MSPTAIGIDIIEIGRIQDAVQRWGDRFLNRIYSEAELKAYRNKTESLAARFAGKEAAIKALNLPPGVIVWRDIEILSEPDGRPVIHLRGYAGERVRELGLSGLNITLSHSRDNAVALVIGIGQD